MADTWQIELFLAQFKKHWLPSCFVVPRDKNNAALADLGLTPYQRREFVLNLTSDNYCSGPEPDADQHGDSVWVFGIRDLDGTEIYIKLKTKNTKDGTVAKCLSFHRAERPLKYPLTGTGGKTK